MGDPSCLGHPLSGNAADPNSNGNFLATMPCSRSLQMTLRIQPVQLPGFDEEGLAKEGPVGGNVSIADAFGNSLTPLTPIVVSLRARQQNAVVSCLDANAQAR